MGHMKIWWIFGFERWGGLRPAEMTTRDGARYVPLCCGLWFHRRLWKVPRRSIYCDSVLTWLAYLIYCFVVLKIRDLIVREG